jgi:hypothetical protein
MKPGWGTLLLLVALGLPAMGQEKEAIDLSSPKASLKSLLTLIKAGAIDRLPECFVEPRTEQERSLLLYGMGDDIYLPALHSALAAKFGEEASPLETTLLAFEQQLRLVDSMDETIDGTHGRLAPRGLTQGGIGLVKTQNDWKLALQPGLMLRPVSPQRAASAQRSRAAYLDTIREISANRYASAGEAMQALELRRRDTATPQGPRGPQGPPAP